MANRHLSAIDFGGNEIQNVVMQQLGSDPTATTGRFYYNTGTNKMRYYNGTTWIDVPGATSGGDAATLSGQTPAYYLSRTNHTDTQLASTISDFNTAVRTNRLDQMAAPTADISMNGFKVTSLADPSNPQDAATKAYVDATATGLDVKQSVRAATTATITLSGVQTIDGVSVIASDRVLVKDQSSGLQNGIYVVAAGSWSRATDVDSSAEVTSGMFTFVTEGTANGDSGWVLTTNDPITLNTTALVFAQFSGTGQITAGTGIVKSGNTLSIDTANGYGVRKYAVSIGDGASTALVITHNFGTRDVEVQVYDNSTPWDTVYPDVERTTTNTVTIRFAVAPTSNQYRVVVIG